MLLILLITIKYIIEPAFNTSIHIETETILKKSSWYFYKQKIIESKIYLNESITLIEIAQSLNIGHTTLSNFINTEENLNFNNWINQLRFSEAQNLMASDPDTPISHITTKTGYSELSNFSREFKQFTVETPST